MADDFWTTWLRKARREGVPENVVVLKERAGSRELAVGALAETVADHLVGLDIIEQLGGFHSAAHVVRNLLPTSKRMRSGDFGEVLASEYVERETSYRVPIKKLRYKDSRELALRGNDVIGVRTERRRPHVIKVEAKSRARLAPKVVRQASSGLALHDGRPDPHTLAFISCRLRREGRVQEAEIFEALQRNDISHDRIEHLIFTLSGNDPAECLAASAGVSHRGIIRTLVGCFVPRHGELIEQIFAACDGRWVSDASA